MTEHLSPTQREEQAYIAALEEELASILDYQRKVLTGISPDTLPLLDAIAELSTGGKRLRALLAYWGWRGAGGASILSEEKPLEIIRAGVALELFQSSALIHDDIIDRSDTRRGNPSVHKRFEATHEAKNWQGDTFNYGLTGGILAGDLTLAWCEQMFSSIGQGALYGTEARRIFDIMRTEVLAGQYLDVYSEVIGSEDADTALARAKNVIRFKSARYSCEHPLTLGGALALGERGHREHALLDSYRAFGLPLGEGFQMRDDELGVFGQPETTGKPAGDDLREGKRTVLVALTLQRTDEAGRALIESALGNADLSDERVEEIRELMKSSGALKELEQMIMLKSMEVDSALRYLEIPSEYRMALHKVASRALHRKH